MSQIKVKTIEQYNDSQGEHIVVKGKLVLIRTNTSQKGLVGKYTNPIIISLTEEIEVGDYGWNITHGLVKVTNLLWAKQERLFKVLVLPDQFSQKHLQAIVDGKLKDGDEVYVECNSDKSIFLVINENRCKYDANDWDITNHIKLFPVKKELSWDDIYEQYSKEYPPFDNQRMSYIEWLVTYFNPPNKKK